MVIMINTSGYNTSNNCSVSFLTSTTAPNSSGQVLVDAASGATFYATANLDSITPPPPPTMTTTTSSRGLVVSGGSTTTATSSFAAAAAAASLFPRIQISTVGQLTNASSLSQQQQQQHIHNHQMHNSNSLVVDTVAAQQLVAKYDELFSYWKDYRLNNLKDNLESFIQQLETLKIQEMTLNNKLKTIQNSLFTTFNDKTISCQNLMMNFQSQMNNLSSRIAVTEDLVTKLVTFFSNLGEVTNTTSTVIQDAFGLNQNQNLNREGALMNNSVNHSRSSKAHTQQLSFTNFSCLRALNDSESEQLEKSQYILPYDLTNVEIPDESTAEIAKKIREYLQITKISQRIFAESLLNMKQANFSSLLSQPLSWSQLSKTYRDRFLIIYLWLNDPFRMDKLDNTNRRKPMMLKPTNNFYKSKAKNTLLATSQQLLQQARMRLDENNRKRTRVCLNNDQTSKLKIAFIKNPYPTSQELDAISVELDLDVKKIAAWFAHQRQVYKIQNKRKQK